MTTQQDCSIGLAKETTYGTGVTPAVFPEFVSESLAWQPEFKQGAGLRVGSRFARSARRVLGKQQAGGDIEVEMVSKGLSKILEALFGTGTATLVETGVYQHLFTPTTTDPLPSYTVQKGIPTVGGGATQAQTFRGGVCASGEFSAAAGDIVKLKTTWNFKDVDTATAYAAPSYAAAPQLFSFAHGAITIGGSATMPTTTALAAGGTVAANIADFSLSLDNKIDEGGFTFGSAGKRGRKPVVGMGEAKGKITAEYTDNTLRDAFLNQTPLSLVLTFTGPNPIGATKYPAFQIAVPEIRLEGELPKANGGELVSQSIDFTVLDGSVASSPLYAAIVTTDTAI